MSDDRLQEIRARLDAASPGRMSTYRVLVRRNDGTVTRSHGFPTYDAALRHLGDVADEWGFDAVAIERVPSSRPMMEADDE